jgi:hypothetical protein
MGRLLQLTAITEILIKQPQKGTKGTKIKTPLNSDMCLLCLFVANHFSLTNPAGSAYASERIMSQSLHRYYYYYGPLSSGRDGSAMGCRRAMQT